MAEHNWVMGDGESESLVVAWRRFVDDRLAYFGDDLDRYGSETEIYGREVVVTAATVDAVLDAAESASNRFAALAIQSGVKPPTGFDPKFERALREAVERALDALLAPESVAYPEHAVVHDADCTRSGVCECIDLVALISVRARERDPDLASDITALALRRAEAGAFSSIRKPERAVGAIYRNLRIDAVRAMARAAMREEPLEDYDGAARDAITGDSSPALAHLLADLLPADEKDSDWGNTWSAADAVKWLEVTELGHHVWTEISDGRLGLPNWAADEDRGSFVAVCVVSVAATVFKAEFESDRAVEELIVRTLKPAVGGRGDSRKALGTQRANRLAPRLRVFIQGLSPAFGDDPLRPAGRWSDA